MIKKVDKKPKVKPIHTLGWWEWVSLPNLKVAKIKAKVDTGAKTSALHAEDIEIFTLKGEKKVRFTIYPNQRDKKNKVTLVRDLIEQRFVKSSIGTKTYRPVILTKLHIGQLIYPVEITLVDRDLLGFRMLLGRQAMRNFFLINPKYCNLLKGKK